MNTQVPRAEEGVLGWIDRDITGPGVGLAYVPGGPGGGRFGSAAAQGDLDTKARRPEQAWRPSRRRTNRL